MLFHLLPLHLNVLICCQFSVHILACSLDSLSATGVRVSYLQGFWIFNSRTSGNECGVVSCQMLSLITMVCLSFVMSCCTISKVQFSQFDLARVVATHEAKGKNRWTKGLPLALYRSVCCACWDYGKEG
jgi:hypothetical protein